MTSHQPDINKIYLCAKDLYEVKYQLLINKQESTGLKNFVDFKAFVEYSNDVVDNCKNFEECNPKKKRRILIVFDNMIADMLLNKKLNLIVTELFARGRKLNTFLVYHTILFCCTKKY